MSMEIQRADPMMHPLELPKTEQRKPFHLEPAPQPIRETPEPREHSDIQRVLDEMLKVTYAFNKRLKFSINHELDSLVVKVVDVTTDRVIKEIPPEELQRLHLRIKEAIGLLVDEII